MVLGHQIIVDGISGISMVVGHVDYAKLHISDVMITSKRTPQYLENMVLTDINWDDVSFLCKDKVIEQQKDSLKLKYISD